MLIQKKDIQLHLCIPHNRDTKNMKQNLVKLKVEIDTHDYSWDVNIPLSVIDRTGGQTTLIDVYRTHHPTRAE